MSKSKEIARLRKELEKYKEYIKGVADQTKRDGLNEGKGFSPTYVRSVIITQKQHNDDVIQSANNWLASSPELMNLTIVELYKQLKKISGFIDGILELTKQKGLNEGKGFAYSYIRDVIIYQKYENADIINTAFDFLNARLEEKRKKQAEFEGRLKDYHAKLAS
jgi:hypothetical protein